MPLDLPVLDQAKSTAVDLAIKFGPRALVAVAIFVAGFYVARWAANIFERWLGKLRLEPPVHQLLVRLLRLSVLAVFVFMALQNLGVDLLPLIAGLGIAGAGIALAMQGVLGNLAAGLMIILTRPFRVGEYVAMAGVEGRVERIELFSTKLSHVDRSLVVVPNRKIVGEILHNYGEIRQLDLALVISRGTDFERALAAAEAALADCPQVLAQPAPVVGANRLAGSSITIAVKPWVKVGDVVAASGALNRAIVERLHAAGIEYPDYVQEVRLLGGGD